MLANLRKDVEESAASPDWRHSKMGYLFNTSEYVWQLDGSQTIYLRSLLDVAESEVASGLRQALAHYAEEVSGATVRQVVSHLREYARINGGLNFNVSGVARYKDSGCSGEENLGHLRSFLLSWFDWGFPGIEEKVIKFLGELTLKGSVKGKTVKGRCPYSGPLTMLEQGALVEWSSNAFMRKEITLQQYALLMTLMLTGRRMVQIRSLRSEDLIAREDESGNEYILRVPRVKQKRGGFRDEFRTVPIEEDIYLLLENLAQNVKQKVGAVLGCEVTSNIAKKLPVFMHESRLIELRNVRELDQVLAETPDYLHMNYAQSMTEMHNINVACRAKSERTGEFIHISSRRFRYTKGTNLARRGIEGTALAYSLDHTDTQHVSVYTENTAANAKYIDEIMSPVLAPLAQAFAGQLIDSEREAHRAADPHSRIKNSGSNDIGNCGTHTFCASGYRACYTCTNFQPWVEAPHYEVKKEVLEERERQKKLGVSPAVIGATDRLLLAVEEVISLCSEAKAKEAIDG